MKPFPEAARALIAGSGESYRSAAEQIGISASYLHRLVAGRKAASVEQMEALAAALGKPSTYFVEVRLARIARTLERDAKRREQIFKDLGLDEG